jgi:hypothetical protein
VTVYLSGTTNLASIYSNNLITPTPLSNPFTANTDGSYTFFVASGYYNVTKSGGGMPSPVTDSYVFVNSSGTVTSIATGAGLTGGPCTTECTISIATGGVTNTMLANSSVTVTAGSGLSGGGQITLGGSATLSQAFPILAVQSPLTMSGTTLTCPGCDSGGGGGITGSGASPYFPIFTNSTGAAVVGDSNLQAVTSPNGLQYSVGSGLYFQIDASHLTWNSGIAGSSNIVIANAYNPGNTNNAGGIIVQAAPTGGEACAGTAQLVGGSTSGSGNGANVSAGGGCANGFGATGSNVTLTAGSTSASNSGGNIVLHPGTGSGGNGSVQISGAAAPAAGMLTIDSSGLIHSQAIPSSSMANLAFLNRDLSSNVSVLANTTTTIDSVTLSALPAACGTNQCRLRISYSYYMSGGVNGACWISSPFTGRPSVDGPISNNFGFCTDNMISTNTFSSGATPTVTISVNNVGSQTACAATDSGSPCNTGDGFAVGLNSNMQVEVILSN